MIYHQNYWQKSLIASIANVIGYSKKHGINFRPDDFVFLWIFNNVLTKFYHAVTSRDILKACSMPCLRKSAIMLGTRREGQRTTQSEFRGDDSVLIHNTRPSRLPLWNAFEFVDHRRQKLAIGLFIQPYQWTFHELLENICSGCCLEPNFAYLQFIQTLFQIRNLSGSC